eukprot:1887335-Pleurochrysis_carterae.AAC.1
MLRTSHWVRGLPPLAARVTCASTPGVQWKVVNFWTWAPRAHIGNVMTAQESRFWRSIIDGISQSGP